MKCLIEVMKTDVVTVPVDMAVPELAGLLSNRMISGAPVVDSKGTLVGVISLADVAVHAASGQVGNLEGHHSRYYRDIDLDGYLADFFTVEDFGTDATVQDIMTPAVYTLGEDATVLEAAQLMYRARIHRVIVTRDGTAVGIVTTMDLMETLCDLLAVAPA